MARKTREELFDLSTAEDLLRDRRGRTVHGLVTNDETLQRQIELERRLGESGGGARAAKAVMGLVTAPAVAQQHTAGITGGSSATPVAKKPRLS